MKNIHLVPTDKPGRLHLGGSGLVLCDLVFNNGTINSQHLYITSDEEIKEGDWVIQVNFEKTNTQLIQCVTNFQVKIANDKNGSFTKKKIILTTDQDLIKDGIQAIDDEFLEWLVKNPSCEFVKTELVYDYEEHSELTGNPREEWSYYKIIIPQEEPKQETLEEAAEKYRKHWVNNTNSTISDTFIAGAKWQAKRMYSEEGVLKILRQFNKDKPKLIFGVEEWFEQIKKK